MWKTIAPVAGFFAMRTSSWRSRITNLAQSDLAHWSKYYRCLQMLRLSVQAWVTCHICFETPTIRVWTSGAYNVHTRSSTMDQTKPAVTIRRYQQSRHSWSTLDFECDCTLASHPSVTNILGLLKTTTRQICTPRIPRTRLISYSSWSEMSRWSSSLSVDSIEPWA